MKTATSNFVKFVAETKKMFFAAKIKEFNFWSQRRDFTEK